MSADTPAQPTATTADKKPTPPAAQKAAKVKSAKKGPKVKKAKKAGKKPAPKDMNKAAEIRKLAAATKANGEKPRPSVLVADLAKRGIKVSAAQVSQVLKKMGFRPLRKRGKKVAAEGAPKAVAGKVAAKGAAGAVSIDDLLAAKKAVVALGGSDRAVEAIQALKRLEG